MRLCCRQQPFKPFLYALYIMCFSLQVSAFAFITCSISCLWLFFYSSSVEYKCIAIYAFFVGLMQLYDFIFWSTHTIKHNTTNFITTKIAMISNFLQPIVLGLSIKYFMYSNKSLPIMSTMILIIYSVFILGYTIYCWNKTDYTVITSESSPSLYWSWNYQKGETFFLILFVATLAILFLENFSIPLKYVLCVLYFCTLGLSFYYIKNRVIGRFWCYFASFIPVILILFNRLNM
jgi:hypothetical protein